MDWIFEQTFRLNPWRQGDTNALDFVGDTAIDGTNEFHVDSGVGENFLEAELNRLTCKNWA